MKTTITLALICFSVFLSGCKRSADEPSVASGGQLPFFNQVNVSFADNPINCLLNQWYGGAYKNEPIVLRVINDANTYATFFSCAPANSLPTIDFNTSSLLIGMKADYGQFINSPVNISGIDQKLVKSSTGSYILQVHVTGKASASGKGGEWFAFASVVPKITGSVSLDMQYQFK